MSNGREIGRRYMRASFLYRYHRRCKPVGYSGEGVWVKVRWHWIGDRSKGRVVSACNAASVLFSTTK